MHRPSAPTRLHFSQVDHLERSYSRLQPRTAQLLRLHEKVSAMRQAIEANATVLDKACFLSYLTTLLLFHITHTHTPACFIPSRPLTTANIERIQKKEIPSDLTIPFLEDMENRLFSPHF